MASANDAVSFAPSPMARGGMLVREQKCDSCRNTRPVVSENGIHHICTLSGTKALRCMINGDYYIPVIRSEDIAKDREFQTALRKAISDYERNR